MTEVYGQSLLDLQRSRHWLLSAAVTIVFAYAAVWTAGWLTAHPPAAHTAHHDAAVGHAAVPGLFSILPFAVLLGSIAVLPVLSRTHHWWENNWHQLQVALGCAAATVLYYTFFYSGTVDNHLTHHAAEAGLHAASAVMMNAWLVEYIPFIMLLFSLYVISGGIVLEGRLAGRPSVNTLLLTIGTALASFVGTTGAAMLLIRPLLRALRERKYKVHTIVFFIFTVCNTGGCLLPIGDPPLFLGFLRGVSFTWTLSLWPMWLTMNIILLSVYFVTDWFLQRREKASGFQPETEPETSTPAALKLRGSLNLLWLAGVVLAVATLDPSRTIPGTDAHPPLYYRELVLLAMTMLSLWTTSPQLRAANSFNYDAILEVAALFPGIFICMQPAVQMLNVYGPELGLDAPWKFFWSTGLLSSCLDNAPTYVVFFETAKTIPGSGPAVAGVPEPFLIAVSLGAVFLGSMTYIGNGPNLMIKAVAESQRIRMPSFFGYLLYSGAVILPTSAVVTWLFLT